MSWRRFLELLTGLSPDSRFAAVASEEAKRRKKRAPKDLSREQRRAWNRAAYGA